MSLKIGRDTQKWDWIDYQLIIRYFARLKVSLQCVSNVIIRIKVKPVRHVSAAFLDWKLTTRIGLYIGQCSVLTRQYKPIFFAY